MGFSLPSIHTHSQKLNAHSLETLNEQKLQEKTAVNLFPRRFKDIKTSRKNS